jgi:hypothetical protein
VFIHHRDRSAPRIHEDNCHCARHTAPYVHVSRQLSYQFQVNATTITMAPNKPYDSAEHAQEHDEFLETLEKYHEKRG